MSSRAYLATGPLSILDPPNGIGDYTYSLTVQAYADSQLANLVAWMLTVGTVNDYRYPTITFDLTRPEVARTCSAAIPTLDVGDFRAGHQPAVVRRFLEHLTTVLGIHRDAERLRLDDFTQHRARGAVLRGQPANLVRGNDVNPEWLAAFVALVVAVCAGLAWVLRWAGRILRRIVHFLDDYSGQPARDGLPARPGLMARLQSVEELIAKVVAETTPNGGGSMRDEVARTARDVATIKDEQAAVRIRLEAFDAVRAAREGQK